MTIARAPQDNRVWMANVRPMPNVDHNDRVMMRLNALMVDAKS